MTPGAAARITRRNCRMACRVFGGATRCTQTQFRRLAWRASTSHRRDATSLKETPAAPRQSPPRDAARARATPHAAFRHPPEDEEADDRQLQRHQNLPQVRGGAFIRLRRGTITGQVTSTTLSATSDINGGMNAKQDQQQGAAIHRTSGLGLASATSPSMMPPTISPFAASYFPMTWRAAAACAATSPKPRDRASC